MLSPLLFQWELDRAPPPEVSIQQQHKAFPEGLGQIEAIKEKEANWVEHYTSGKMAALLTPTWACPMAAVELGAQPSIGSFPSSYLSSEFQGQKSNIFCYFMM